MSISIILLVVIIAIAICSFLALWAFSDIIKVLQGQVGELQSMNLESKIDIWEQKHDKLLRDIRATTKLINTDYKAREAPDDSQN